MTKPNPHPTPAARSAHKSRRLIAPLFLGVLILGALVLGLHLVSRSADPAEAEAKGAPSPQAAEPTSLYGALLGRWLRTDGDYLLDIRTIDGSGKAQVDYFNPRPIHVARAEAVREGQFLKIVIVLEDVGYPGSYYTLTFSPTNKTLTGDYYQAVMQETFDVIFKRLP